MMLGKFFDSAPVHGIARELVDEMRRTLPPVRALDETKQGTKLRQALDDRLQKRIDALARSQPLNVYQKARLGGVLEDAMREAGYPASLSATLPYELVKRLAFAAARGR